MTAMTRIFIQVRRLAVFRSIRRSSSLGSFDCGWGAFEDHGREPVMQAPIRSIR